jgi:hypothetical protein
VLNSDQKWHLNCGFHWLDVDSTAKTLFGIRKAPRSATIRTNQASHDDQNLCSVPLRLLVKG